MQPDLSRIAAASHSSFSGEGWRHLSPKHDALSGEGARLNGGRFNPPGSFPVLYICRTRACAVAELQRFGDRHAIGIEGLLPRRVYRYQIELDKVLDLTTDGGRADVDVGLETLIGPDWSACQELGAAAYGLGVQAIRSPSATGVDDILAVFVQRIGVGGLHPTMVEEWRVLDDLLDSTEG